MNLQAQLPAFIDTDMDDTGLEQNPSTIAYVMLAMLSGALDLEYVSELDVIGNEALSVMDDDGNRLFSLGVSPAMGDLLIAILEEVGAQLVGA